MAARAERRPEPIGARRVTECGERLGGVDVRDTVHDSVDERSDHPYVAAIGQRLRRTPPHHWIIIRHNGFSRLRTIP
ncbi:hypothetical protein nbrc107696_46190 [Gordonia spumicola]|uniref:Uncharacterized protein n=1 Tax=Gordonia spumicola TaxID=589161 RepID=A0A7I9VGE9_9ACTN|nr:hypothetical protein nbrc107696_46190 [Gordonia spumicola]